MWTSRRSDGQFRSRAYQYWCRKNCISELTRITKSIQDGDFFEKKEFLDAAENCRKHNSKLHLFGLLSDGGVHSHNTHLYGLLEFAKRQNLKDVYVHCFFDGRDVPPDSAMGYVKSLK